MSDLQLALAAKSDQLNATDIMGYEPIIRIRDVRVTPKQEQPISIYFDGDNNKPWKPSKGMGRILWAAWGDDYSKWAGRYAQIYFDPEVIFGGQKVGGIRIRALSDIPEAGLNCVLTLNRAKRIPYHVPRLVLQEAEYPEDRFAAALPAMQKKLESKEMTLQQIIAKCQATGRLNESQLQRLENLVPIEISEDDNEDEEKY